MAGVNNKISKPYDRTVSRVLGVITDSPKINRRGIKLATLHSDNCIDRCIAYLLHTGNISRTETGMRGAHMSHSYEVNN